jgi:tRNA U34 5-carboxymethylaminomethyl modifying GTPase MnmE/TrmE
MTPEAQYSSIKAIGKIESIKNEIEQMDQFLDSALLWRPASALKRQCREVIGMIDALQERFEHKLVVTLIGPSGAGKSTLLNALAGVDHLSPTGHQRPTTRDLVILSSEQQHAEQLQRKIGHEKINIVTSKASSAFEHIIIIDTPDTDSTEQEQHIPMVKQTIELSDILICLFDCENPKRKDYVDFLSPYVQLFHGEALIVVLNKCDRQREQDLKKNIIPDFGTYLQKAWEKPVHHLLCICARNHLKNPDWDPKAIPLHHFDQFDKLRDIIFGTFNRAAYVIDRRLENAINLKNYLFKEIQTEAQTDAKMLDYAREQLLALEIQAVKEAAISFRIKDSDRFLGINVLLYQKLAQKWFGPVGWLIAMWARILIFGTGMAAIFRFGNPIREIWRVMSSLIHFKTSQAAVAITNSNHKAESSLRNYRLSILKQWPVIAEAMIKGRFDYSVRNPETTGKDNEAIIQAISSLWLDALDESILKTANRFSGFFIQLIFNIPTLGILCHAAYLSTIHYFAGDYFSTEFFIHAFLTMIIILFLSFFILQALIRIFGKTRQINSRTLHLIKSRVETWPGNVSNPLINHIQSVLILASVSNIEQSNEKNRQQYRTR